MAEWVSSSTLELPPPIDEDVERWVSDTLAIGRVLLAERSGRALGCCGLVRMASPWNTTQDYMGNTFFYVSRAHRHTGVSMALASECRAVAAAWELPLVLNITGNTNSPQATVGAYKADGFAYSGSTLTAGFPLKTEVH